MKSQFSNLDIQLIRASLATKTDEEIAELLEQPVEEVIQTIDKITGGGAAARMQRIQEARAAIQRMEEEKRKLKAERKERAERKKRPRTDGEIMEQVKIDNARVIADQQKLRTRLREQAKTFQKKEVDWSLMKTVLVTKGTYIIVPKETSQEDAIKQYNANRDKSRDAEFEKDIKNLK